MLHHSLEEAAERCGITAYTLRQIEEGKQQPTIVTLEKIAHGYGIRLMSLMASVDQERKVRVEHLDENRE